MRAINLSTKILLMMMLGSLISSLKKIGDLPSIFLSMQHSISVHSAAVHMVCANETLPSHEYLDSWCRSALA